MSRASRRRARVTRAQADFDRNVAFLLDVIVTQHAEIKRLQEGTQIRSSAADLAGRPAAPVLRLVPRDGG